MKILPFKTNRVSYTLSYLRSILFLGILMLVFFYPLPSLAAVSDFQYSAPITTCHDSSGYNLLELSADVLAQTQSGAPDLRIYSDDEEIPYAVVNAQDFVTSRVEPAKIINQGQDPQGNLQFEVLIPPYQWVRQFTILSSDKNFIRQVKVEGSRNQKDWLILTEDSTIFDLTEEHKAQHLEVNLQPTNFSYLRVTIFNEGKGAFHFGGVNLLAQNQTEVAVGLRERPFRRLSQRNQDGIQEFTLDLLQPNLRANELEIVTDQVNFSRQVELFASNNNQDWDLTTEGELYALQLDNLTAKQLVLKLNTHHRYLKLKISNQDNQPLNIMGMHIRGFNPMVIFPVDASKNMILYWGNPQIKAPAYDIEKIKSNLDYVKMPRAALGPAGANQDYQFNDNRPWTERHSWMLQGILVLAAIALLIIILFNIKKIASAK